MPDESNGKKSPDTTDLLAYKPNEETLARVSQRTGKLTEIREHLARAYRGAADMRVWTGMDRNDAPVLNETMAKLLALVDLIDEARGRKVDDKSQQRDG